MLKLIGLLFFLTLIAAAVGYYLGWFSFTTTQDGQSAHISVVVDKAKIEHDRQLAKQKLTELRSRSDTTSVPPAGR